MTNKELVIGFFVEGYMYHHYDFLKENMAADYYDNSPCAARTNQQCVNILRSTESIFPDMQVKILDLIEENNMVTSRVCFTGTHQAEIYGIPATGKKIRFEALEFFRIENGKLQNRGAIGRICRLKNCSLMNKAKQLIVSDRGMICRAAPAILSLLLAGKRYLK